jgi:hypothetical protein
MALTVFLWPHRGHFKLTLAWRAAEPCFNEHLERFYPFKFPRSIFEDFSVTSTQLSFIDCRPIFNVSLESKELLTDDFKIYSEGLLNALKHDKLVEARGYVSDLRISLDTISNYVNSQISYIESPRAEELTNPLDVARSEAEVAVFAAKRADEKAERLEKAAKETREESKRLKKAAGHAKKEAEKAWHSARRAEKSERKATKESTKAAEHASKANQAARRS